MALKAWIDEADTLYITGEDGGHDAITAGAQEVIDAANDYLEDCEEYEKISWDDIVDFRTLWVDLEMLREEQWDDRYWSDTISDEAGKANGWQPVLAIDLEMIA